MASPTLLRNSIRKDLYVCARCALSATKKANKPTKRWISMKYLARMADAEDAWQQKASRIRSGRQKSMLKMLEERDLIQQITGTREALDEALTSRRLGAYVGVDPTAPSLHVGHMIPLMSLFWLYVNGYHTVSLLGGATAKIGDPTDRLTSREREPSSIRTANMANMHVQLKRLWLNVEAYGRRHGYEFDWSNHRELVNNNAWWNSLPMLEVLQVLGPGMRIGSMLARETVKNKMNKGDGMSWAEFTYPLMQAWDWWHMYKTKGISMQIGGSDQYGNITAGIDAVKYVKSHHPDPILRETVSGAGDPIGFTVPLLTTSSGQKFGKSAGNAVWLDDDKTTAFELYGYFLRTADADVAKYLKMFTFLPLEEIEMIVKEHTENPSQRKAQHKLASEFLELVHGLQKSKEAAEQHRLLFQNGPAAISPDGLAQTTASSGPVTYNNRPKVHVKLPRRIIFQGHMPAIFVACGLEASNSKAWRLINARGGYIGGARGKDKVGPMPDGHIEWRKVTASWDPADTKKYLIHGDILMLRKGKPDVRIIQVVSDEEYALSDETYPGMDPNFKVDVLTALKVRKGLQSKEQVSMEDLKGEEDDASNISKLIAEDKAASARG